MASFADLRLETPRLVLRPARHADAPELFAIYADPQVYRYIPVGAWKHVDEAHQRIARSVDVMASGEEVRLGIQRREDARLIGELLLFHFDKGSRRADVGYVLARDAWGCGYVSEALLPLLDFAFGELQMRRLEAQIDPRNTASAKVLERLGFRQEGFLRERWILRGEVSDGGIYGLLAAEWTARAAAA
jgi:RimJ/RimL family protein N-acetyltransferase